MDVAIEAANLLADRRLTHAIGQPLSNKLIQMTIFQLHELHQADWAAPKR